MLLALIVMACLLFQQVAVAAYACQSPSAPKPEHPSHCSEAANAPAPAPMSALCEKHCAPDASVLTDASALGVPALALPPVFALVLHEPSEQVHVAVVPIDRSDPPPRLRYCSLLI
jgi:hypothetical protein